MLVYPEGSDSPLRGDLLLRVVLRTDLTPVPATVEIEVRRTAETVAAIAHGKTIRVADWAEPFEIIQVRERTVWDQAQGDRPYTAISATALLQSCAAIALPLQRSVISESASLGGIYRACGASVRIGSDFAVPVFAAYVGQTPSFMVATVLQEEGGALLLESGGRVTFRRLRELMSAPAAVQIGEDASESVESGLLERQAIPFAVSTLPAGQFVYGRRSAARGFVYRPRGDQRIVNNLGTALVLRRKMRGTLSLDYNAGARVDVAGNPHVAITVAHVFEARDGGQQYSQYWLGELTE